MQEERPFRTVDCGTNGRLIDAIARRMFCWLFVAGGSVQKPCYTMTATGEMTNQMRTGEAIDSGSVGASMDTDGIVSSFTVRILM